MDDAGRFGHVEIADFENEVLNDSSGSSLTVECKRSQYIWRPTEKLLSEVPHDLAISFDVYKAADGIRRFAARGGLQVLTPRAWIAGLAILGTTRPFSKEHFHLHQVMWHVFHKAQSLQARLKRKFSSPADLIVKRSGREGGNELTVLPTSLGKTADGNGRRWSVDRLLKAGRERAIQEGHTRVNTPEAIAYGLLAAAELNPLRLKKSDVPSLVRMALFDCDKHSAVSEDLVQNVYRRAVRAIHAHLDDSQTQFDAWYTGAKSNFFKSLAGQSRAEGGKLPIEEVRAAWLELTWRSYGYVAECLDVFSRTFQSDLPDPLTPREARLFSHMYQRQDYLGNLPLALLLDRSPLLKPALLQVHDSLGVVVPTGVIWQLLNYYQEMISSRRGADRRIKAKGRAKKPARSSDSSGTQLDAGELQRMAATLAEMKGMRCRSAKCSLKFKLEAAPVRRIAAILTAECSKHGTLAPVNVTAKEIRQLSGEADDED